jgi:hypothetical protein
MRSIHDPHGLPDISAIKLWCARLRPCAENAAQGALPCRQKAATHSFRRHGRRPHRTKEPPKQAKYPYRSSNDDMRKAFPSADRGSTCGHILFIHIYIFGFSESQCQCYPKPEQAGQSMIEEKKNFSRNASIRFLCTAHRRPCFSNLPKAAHRQSDTITHQKLLRVNKCESSRARRRSYRRVVVVVVVADFALKESSLPRKEKVMAGRGFLPSTTVAWALCLLNRRLVPKSSFAVVESHHRERQGCRWLTFSRTNQEESVHALLTVR